jgi:tRNA pseudouridine32 synthase/23S rRNA pseudouridine746 synthase
MTPPDTVDVALTSGITCLYQDDDLLVLAKPPGLLCVPGRGPDKQDCLSARAQARWPGALVVHRLDQATSGLVLMARHIEAQRRLGDAFAQRRVDKRYQAVVRGLPQPDDHAGDTGGWSLIDLPLIADWPNRPLQKVDREHGKPSQTRWRSVRHDAARGVTLLDLEPLTGRSHQLRLHLASIGHPILGDALYADAATQAMAPRLLLHACALAFAHPLGGQPCCFTLPAEFGKNGL